ncbi:MAG: hypothetical protein UFS73_08130 [Weissella confusa]|uniref:hypothetical protein n=1 Tax=Weissella confusa TaxID=1583 RepID=UPI0022E5115D|nr:hypothetical protein [Weissella confusa]MEE0002574.1 hypothetical protein [Weissella confusa]
MIDKTTVDEWISDFHKNTPGQVIGNLLPTKAFEYLKNNDFAFVIGLISDQSIASEKAWILPLHLAERLHAPQLTPEVVLQNALVLDAVIREKPSLHRFPNRMANYFIAAANRFVDLRLSLQNNFSTETFGEVQNELLGFKGISLKKAGLGILIQSIDFGRKISDQNKSVALLDAHVNRFLEQHTSVESNSIEDATEIFRAINPENPALVSTWVWGKDKFD